MEDSRRNFLKKGALLGLSGFATGLLGNEKIQSIQDATHFLSETGKYTLPKLPYAYDALEPFIDKQTMEIHYDKHHQAYVDKLNKALENYKGDTSLESLFKNVSNVDPAIRNNAGGHYNHSLFWQLLKPSPSGVSTLGEGKLMSAIVKQFKSFDDFKKEFSDKALKIFGSGWCWLIIENNNLKIIATPNQDNPLMSTATDKGTPVLALDVWEHAYYLKYQNKRADYISNWWNIINWEKSQELFNANNH